MNEIAIGVIKKRQAVSLRLKRFTDHSDAFGFEIRNSGIEIVNRNGKVPEAGVFIIY